MPVPRGYVFVPLIDRLWTYIEPEPNSGCWLWTGTRSRGYGRITVAGRKQPAHRALYELLFGAVRADLEMDHLCRVRSCVNPAHLEPVTHRINGVRGRGRITHCPQGHAYDERNTYVEHNGHRNCRACNAASQRRRKVRHSLHGAPALIP